jgi:hypothetical protein
MSSLTLDNAVWAIFSTYHTVLKASPGNPIFGPDMLFDIPFVANWNKIGDYGNAKPILTQHARTARKLIMITKFAIRFW